MAELTQEQLLILNNLMYYDAPANAKSAGEIAMYLKNNASNSNLKGGLDSEQMTKIADAILSDNSLKNLQVAGSLNEHNVSAKCFVDPSTGEATIAIRGTGGSYEAWKDNALGGYETDTVCQQTLSNWVGDIGEKYSDITITGHSKGGNLAQYATIKNGDKIDRCVSFDGQGFNKDFIAENKAEIEANSYKITSVNAYNDYVNILLTSIAGTTVYLHNNADGIDAHSSYYLWESNQGQVDSNGEYINKVEQAWQMKSLKWILDRITDTIGFFPDSLQKELFSFLGSVLGIVFDRQLTAAEWEDVFRSAGRFKLSLSYPLIMMLLNWLKETFGVSDGRNGNKANAKKPKKKNRASGSGKGNSVFEVRPSDLSRLSVELEDINCGLESALSEIRTIKYEEVMSVINGINSLLTNTNKDIKKMSDTLNEAGRLYKKCESEIITEWLE